MKNIEFAESVDEDFENDLKETASEKFLNTKGKVIKRIMTGTFLVAFVTVGIFLFHQYRLGTFKDPDTFKEYINSLGYLGPVALTVFQCVKVLYAVIPGTIGCIVGPMIFGPVGGFVCNYVGICSGSVLAFLLSRKFGFSLMRMIFPDKKIRSYKNWMNKWTKHFHIFLWIAICLPISPDDFLCYFTGLTQMKFKKFLIIILTSKPLTIIVYSLIFGNIL
ncbi:MAG: TVP38/TMEM64 family protein [Treponema sp.]|nr:TVP38/TMEM64 family protein [Treponema sp.]